MADIDPFKGKSVSHHMVMGSIWMIGMRWAMRAIGLVSTVILARLLAPEDFGLVAMAMLSVAFVEVLMESGLKLALIRHPAPTREHYDTAWTLQFVTGVLVCAASLAIAPLAVAWFNEPRAGILVQLLGLRAVMIGLENIGTVDFLRDLNFSRDFRFNVTQRMLAFVTTVAAALILRSYWALIIGLLGSRMLTLGLSYAMHPYRPRFGLSKTREMWSFSAWTFGISYATFLSQRVDELIVGRIWGAVEMGYYNVSADVATFVTQEIANPLQRSLYPIYAKLVDDPEALAERYLQALSLLVVAAFSIGAGVAIVAEELVLVAFGEKWLPLAPLIPWLSVAGAIQMLSVSSVPVLQAMNRAHLPSLMQMATLAALLVALPIGARYGLEGVAAARMATIALLMPVTFVVIMRMLPVTLADLWAVTWRPALAAAAMTWVDLATPTPFDAVAATLLFRIALGAIVFAATLSALWFAAGRPVGAEVYLMRLVRSRL